MTELVTQSFEASSEPSPWLDPFAPMPYELPSDLICDDGQSRFNQDLIPELWNEFATGWNEEVRRIEMADVQKSTALNLAGITRSWWTDTDNGEDHSAAMLRYSEHAVHDVEQTPERSFLADARMLRLMLDTTAAALEVADEVALIPDNDRTISYKTNVGMTGKDYQDMRDGVDRSSRRTDTAEGRAAMQSDFESTRFRAAWFLGVRELKRLHGGRVKVGESSLNNQGLFDQYHLPLFEEECGPDVVEPDYMISARDGRFSDDMADEIAAVIVDTNNESADYKHKSPTMREQLSPDCSPAYDGLETFIDFDHPDAQTVGSQDLKIGVGIRLSHEINQRNLRDWEDTYRDVPLHDRPAPKKTLVVQLDDIAAPMIHNSSSDEYWYVCISDSGAEYIAPESFW